MRIPILADLPALRYLSVALLITGSLALAADPKQLPPPGISVPPADRAELESGIERLSAALRPLEGNPLYPDAAIYLKAVRFALEGNEFFKPAEIARAKDLLKEGQARAETLARGAAPWSSANGLVVRAYRSKIDGSLQPYGLVIPPSFAPDRPHRWRLDAWFHGRNETLSEVNFIGDRERNPGEFTPRDTIVLHLYGRYCNANKFAGEVDFFEALDDVKKHYNIDEHRILVRGFSMGGAATWHIGAHHAGEWAAAAPGAGFAETREFVPEFHKEQIFPTWWEEKLWHLTDATDYALNFAQLPVVAYNGEIDSQKQAADIMARYLAAEGMQLTRVIGPKTAHKYHPDSKIEINRLIDAIAERGNDFYPRKLHFTTWTLAYNRMKWLVVDGLGSHWERARVDAELTDDHTVTARTSNVSALSFSFGAGGATALDETSKAAVILDGDRLSVPGPATDRSWSAHFHKDGAHWMVGEATGLRKRHSLQGPIDDAFLDSFVMVRPTGTPMFPALSPWVASEEARAGREWRRQFRGEVRERADTELTDADMAASNLILWGDPGSNRVLGRMAAQLPIRWDRSGLRAANATYPADSSMLILIYPNPLNPSKYVVLNSGFTFRESAYFSNALQTAQLPDYAVVDTGTPPDPKWPGKILEAGFFTEEWKLPSRRQ